LTFLTSPKKFKEVLKLTGLLLIMCAGLTSAVLHAQPAAPASEQRPVPQAPEPAEAQRQGDEPASANINQKQALDIARARFSGNVISINEVRSRNAAMRYRIRMDNEGNIFTVFVDSRSGTVTRE
jgi:uncharacterized membrane protein YkoI